MKTLYRINFALMIISLSVILAYFSYSNITGYVNIHIVCVSIIAILTVVFNYVLLFPLLFDSKR